MADQTDWNPGPPHIFAGIKGAPPDAGCRVCGVRKDRAIHDAAFWARQRQLALLTPEAYLDWTVKRNAR